MLTLSYHPFPPFLPLPGVYYLLSTPAPCPGLLIFPPIAHHHHNHHHKAQVHWTGLLVYMKVCLFASQICRSI